MTEDEIRAAYLAALTDVAPDLSADEIGPDDHLQDDLELDSMDVLNLVAALHKATGVDIPEADYPQIATLRLAVPYLARRMAE
ncbi:MAG: acyl carrier protein [Rhodovulum sp.]